MTKLFLKKRTVENYYNCYCSFFFFGYKKKINCSCFFMPYLLMQFCTFPNIRLKTQYSIAEHYARQITLLPLEVGLNLLLSSYCFLTSFKFLGFTKACCSGLILIDLLFPCFMMCIVKVLFALYDFVPSAKGKYCFYCSDK